MSFEDFLVQGKVRRAEKDKALATSLVKTAQQDMVFLDAVTLDKNSVRKLVSNYYDTLRALVEALAVLDGYKVYSHEAFTYYLREIRHEDVLSQKFDRYRKIRNRLNYYGKEISVDEGRESISEMKKLIDLIINKIGGIY